MIASLLLSGCTSFGPWPDTGTVDTGEPSERVIASPGWLDFGAVSVNGEGYAESTFTLYNEGTGTVTVSGQDEPVGSEAFTVAAPPVLELDPDAELELTVRYTPTTEQADSAQILIDPSGETILLEGAGTAPVLDAAPAWVDPVVLGCSGAGGVTLTNTGSEDLVLTDASIDGEFSVTSVPTTLGPGQSGDIALGFTPLGGGPRGATLLLATNDPLRPEVGIAVSGLGYEGERVTETFRYSPSNPTDVVFVVGTGDIQPQDLAKAASAIPDFVDTLRDANVDYHLLALSGAGPCPASTPGWTDRTDTALQAESMLDRGFAADGGPWDSDLVGLAADALDNTGTGGCLEGFRRADADLQVIVVAGGPSDADVEDEAENIERSLQEPASLVVSALVPTEPTCGALAGDYASLAERYDGHVWDLCAEDWTPAFLDFGSPPAGSAPVSYTLAEVPVTSSIEVLAEGSPFLQWSWNADANAVVFDGEQVPALGAEITLSYVSSVACD